MCVKVKNIFKKKKQNNNSVNQLPFLLKQNKQKIQVNTLNTDKNSFSRKTNVYVPFI